MVILLGGASLDGIQDEGIIRSFQPDLLPGGELSCIKLLGYPFVINDLEQNPEEGLPELRGCLS